MVVPSSCVDVAELSEDVFLSCLGDIESMSRSRILHKSSLFMTVHYADKCAVAFLGFRLAFLADPERSAD